MKKCLAAKLIIFNYTFISHWLSDILRKVNRLGLRLKFAVHSEPVFLLDGTKPNYTIERTTSPPVYGWRCSPNS